MPDGSSSEAPVTSPGPSTLRNRFTGFFSARSSAVIGSTGRFACTHGSSPGLTAGDRGAAGWGTVASCPSPDSLRNPAEPVMTGRHPGQGRRSQPVGPISRSVPTKPLVLRRRLRATRPDTPPRPRMEPAMSSPTISIHLPVPGSRAGWLATGVALGMLGAVLAGPLLSVRPALATDPTGAAEHTISVSGTGRIVLSPDTADLRLGVSATAKTVKAARSLAATSMTAVIASLKKLGIADKDIQTTTLSRQPTYDYSANTNPPRLTGYQLSN